MRRLVLALIVVCLGILPALAQGAAVTINPASGTRGQNFTITAVRLPANTTFTFDILLASTNRVVFSTTRQSNAAGEAVLAIRSDDTDALGEYIVQVKQGSTVLAETRFSLIDPSQATPTPPQPTSIPVTPDARTPQIQPTVPPPTLAPVTPNPATPQIQPPAAGASVTIVPSAGEIRSLFTVYVDDLNPRQTVFVTVREAATSLIVYDRQWQADANGSIVVELFTTADNQPGEYRVTVESETGETLGAASFTLTGAAGRDGVVAVEPPAGEAGSTFSISVSRARPFVDLTITIIDPDTRAEVFRTIARTNVDGVVSTSFTAPADLAEKTYNVRVTDIDGDVASGTLTIGQLASPDPLRVSVNPAEGAAGRVFTVTALGLPPNSSAEITITDPNGAVARVFTPQTNRRGATSITFSPPADAPLGTYQVSVTSGSASVSGSFVVTQPPPPPTPEPTPEPTTEPAATGATLVVEPVQGIRGTTHNITLSGAPADTVVTFVVTYDGQQVYTTDKTTDASGAALLALTSENTDPLGVYTVDVLLNGEAIATATLEIVETVAVPPIATLPADTGVSIAIEPAAGPVGTSHLVTVTGLEPDSALTLNVLFNGSVVYTTDRVADASGNFSMRLKADPGDPSGPYTVAIVAGGQTVAEATLTVSAPASAGGGLVGVPVQPNERSAEVLQGEVSARVESVEYAITLQQGELLRVAAESDSFDTFLQILDSTGMELAYNDDYNLDINTNSEISAFIAPYDGEFTVVVTSYEAYFDTGSAAGGFTLTLERILPTPVNVDEAVLVTFDGEASTQYLMVELVSGSVVSVYAEGALDTQVVMFNTEGVELARDDDGGIGFNPEIPRYVATYTGPHLLAFSTYDAGSVGESTLIVQTAGVNSLDAGARNLSLSSKLLADTVTFTGAAGTTAVVNIDHLGGTATSIAINVTQGGSTLTDFVSSFGIPGRLLLPVVVPADGTVVMSFSISSGTAQFAIEHAEEPAGQP
jgi:hypothetical protein